MPYRLNRKCDRVFEKRLVCKQVTYPPGAKKLCRGVQPSSDTLQDAAASVPRFSPQVPASCMRARNPRVFRIPCIQPADERARATFYKPHKRMPGAVLYAAVLTRKPAARRFFYASYRCSARTFFTARPAPAAAPPSLPWAGRRHRSSRPLCPG